MKKEILTFIGIWSFFMIIPCFAAEKQETHKYNLGEIIVSATKTESYQAETGSSSTVITGEEIEKSGKTEVLDILREVPGVSVMQSGSFGGTTYVHLRGAKTGHTLILIDGVKVSDPIKSDSSFDFAHLNTDNIERIEVVRGPQSTLYGSDAMGGVINIITKKGKSEPKLTFTSQAGSYNTFRENVAFSGATETTNYTLSASRLDSEGTSKSVNGSEKDGYKNTSISSRLGYKISDISELNMSLRFADAETKLDKGNYEDRPNYTTWWRNISGKAALDQSLTSIWNHKLSYSYSQTLRKYNDNPNTQNWFKSNINKFEWQNNISPVDWNTFTAGFEYEEQRGIGDGRAASNRIDKKTIANQGYYLQNQLTLLENIFITPGIRIDDYHLFGTETTYKISTSYIIFQTKTQIKGNWGTAFKTPSFYQLYSNNGNPNLNPDKSESYDFGFTQSLNNDKISFGATFFNNDFKNMIDWNSGYKNIKNVNTQGFESELLLHLIDNVDIGVNYTRTKTKDKATEKKLQRQPEDQIGVNLTWSFLEKGTVNLQTTYAGHSWGDDDNTDKVKHYTKADIAASYKITDKLQIFGRIENIFDRQYEEVRGYATKNRAFSAGTKIVW